MPRVLLLAVAVAVAACGLRSASVDRSKLGPPCPSASCPPPPSPGLGYVCADYTAIDPSIPVSCIATPNANPCVAVDCGDHRTCTVDETVPERVGCW